MKTLSQEETENCIYAAMTETITADSDDGDILNFVNEMVEFGLNEGDEFEIDEEHAEAFATEYRDKLLRKKLKSQGV